MDKEFYKVITDGVFEVIKPKNFRVETFDKGEYFTDGQKAFMIDYDKEKTLISLKFALLEEGEGVDFKELSSWLMDENATEQDMLSIKNDFCDSVLENLGAKPTATGVQKIEMPSKKKNADSIDTESFAARFLAIYPAHKDAYKENVSKYGEFLYDDFFSKYGVLELQNALKDGTKRQISKYFELLNLAYTNGEKNVASTVIYAIICRTLLSDKPCEREMALQLEKYPHLNKAVANAKAILKSPKMKSKYFN